MSSLTSAQVVNSALELIAAQTQITSLTDGSPSANAAQIVYAPTVQLMLRELNPDFARTTKGLALSGAATPPPPWAFEYLYPADCVRLRQVRPPASGTGLLADPNNPYPVRSNVAFDTIGVTPTKVVLSNQVNALAVYTTSSITEAMWDAAFTDAVIRRLGNPLAMALSGRPDFSKELLEEASRVGATCEVVDESSFRRMG